MTLTQAKKQLSKGMFKAVHPITGEMTAVVDQGIVIKLVEELTEKLSRSITWSIEDFEQRAQDLTESDEDEGVDWERIYNKKMFPNALKRMIHDHDCNEGISWATIDSYLESDCKRN